MAQKRMLNKLISVSEQVDNICDRAKIAFSWGISHADDIGLLPYSIKSLKSLIAPMWEITYDEFGSLVKEIIRTKKNRKS